MYDMSRIAAFLLLSFFQIKLKQKIYLLKYFLGTYFILFISKIFGSKYEKSEKNGNCSPNIHMLIDKLFWCGSWIWSLYIRIVIYLLFNHRISRIFRHLKNKLQFIKCRTHIQGPHEARISTNIFMTDFCLLFKIK